MAAKRSRAQRRCCSDVAMAGQYIWRRGIASRDEEAHHYAMRDARRSCVHTPS